VLLSTDPLGVLENSGIRMGKKKIFTDKNLQCTVCGNTSWKKDQGEEEKCEDYHYHLTPSTDLSLRLKKQHLGTWDSTFRAILAGYEAYDAIQQRQRMREMTGIRTQFPDVNQE
jgi:hypothetical protein